MRSLWDKANLNWVWTWMAVYNGSLSMLAAYMASSFAAAAAKDIRSQNKELKFAPSSFFLLTS